MQLPNIYIVTPISGKPTAYSRAALGLLAPVLGGKELLKWADEKSIEEKEVKIVYIGENKEAPIAEVAESKLHTLDTATTETLTKRNPTQNDTPPSESTTKPCDNPAWGSPMPAPRLIKRGGVPVDQEAPEQAENL